MTQITVSVKDACQMAGIGKTKLYELVNDGKVETIAIGRRRLVKVDSLYRLLDTPRIAA